MMALVRIAVTSRSFSSHPVLRKELMEKYEQVTFNQSGQALAGQALVQFLKGHERAIIAIESLKKEMLDQLPELKVISKFGVGLDGLDLEALQDKGIGLAWQGGVNKRSVSELVLALVIDLLRHVVRSNLEMRQGIWKQHKGNYLTGRTIGIVGCGHIGKDLIELLKPFQCRMLCYDTKPDTAFLKDVGAQCVSLEELLRSSDVVSLHLPLTSETHLILNEAKLSLLKPTAILINTARGGLVDEKKLKEMLKEGRLSGAAFDVFLTEPPKDKELMALPNFIATSHIGGSTEEAILAMGRAAIQGLETAKSIQEWGFAKQEVLK